MIETAWTIQAVSIHGTRSAPWGHELKSCRRLCCRGFDIWNAQESHCQGQDSSRGTVSALL